MKRYISAIIFFFCTVSLLHSQNISEDQMDDFLFGTAVTIEFDPPDSTYQQMEDMPGYENQKTQSTISYLAIPSPFEETVKEFSDAEAEPGVKVISKNYVTQGDKSCYLIKSEAESPDPAYENYYVVTILIPNGKNCITMFAAYPASLDIDLYPKMIKSFESMKIIE